MIVKDKHIDIFLKKLERGELIYRNGQIYHCFNQRGNYLVVPKIAGRKNTSGYIQLSARLDGKEVSSAAHRVIWAYFNSRENLRQDYEVNHINGNKLDNKIENLESITSSENQKHAYRIGLKVPMFGEKNPDSRLSTKQVLRIKELILLGLLDVEIAKIYDVSSVNIRNIRKGKIWSDITGFSQDKSINREETL